jgi:hypothetical protein
MCHECALCVRVVSELVLACIFQVGREVEKEITMIHIKWYQSGNLFVYYRQRRRKTEHWRTLWGLVCR